jgi:hypothetical protein
VSNVDLHLSGLIRTASYPDVQKIRIIVFPLNIGNICSLTWKKFLQTAVLGYIVIYVQIKHRYIIPYIYLTIGGKFRPYKNAVQLQCENV